MITTIIFDLDGTLMNTLDDLHDSTESEAGHTSLSGQWNQELGEQECGTNLS